MELSLALALQGWHQYRSQDVPKQGIHVVGSLLSPELLDLLRLLSEKGGSRLGMFPNGLEPLRPGVEVSLRQFKLGLGLEINLQWTG